MGFCPEAWSSVTKSPFHLAFLKMSRGFAYGSHAQSLSVTRKAQMIKKKGKKSEPLSHMAARRRGGCATGGPGTWRS